MRRSSLGNLFDEDDAFVLVDPANLGRWSHTTTIVPPCVLRIDQILDQFDRTTLLAVTAFPIPPISGVKVFDRINAAAAERRPKQFEAGALVAPDVRPVVEDDVGLPDFLDDRPEKGGIVLRADANEIGRVDPGRTGAVDVEATDRRPRSKIIAPHLERPAFGNANLEEHEVGVAPGSEIAIVKVQIIDPFVDQSPAMLEELIAKRTRRAIPDFLRRRGVIANILRPADKPERSGWLAEKQLESLVGQVDAKSPTVSLGSYILLPGEGRGPGGGSRK